MPRAIIFILATIAIDAIGWGIVTPVLPRLLMQIGHVGLDEATRIGGFMWLSFAAMQFLFGSFMGNLGDRFGRRPVLLGSLVGLALDYALLAVAPSVGWFLAGRMIAGVFGACWIPASAALADITPPEQRARVFGLISAAFGTGLILGPAIGGLLAELGPRVPFWVAGGLSAANLLYGLLFFPETLAREKRRRFELKRANPFGALRSLRHLGGVLPLSLVYFLWCMASQIYPATWSFFTVAAFGWSPGLVGLSLAWMGMWQIAMQTLGLRRIIARIGERGALVLGLLAAATVYTTLALLRDGRFAIPVLTLAAVHALVQPSLMGLMSRRVPADAQGELQGFNGSIVALAAILAPVVLNWPLAWFTGPHAPIYFPGAAFAVAATFALLALATFAVVIRRSPRIHSGAAPSATPDAPLPQHHG